MKLFTKTTFLLSIMASSLLSHTIAVDKGWHLKGAVEHIEDTKVFKDSCIDSIWTYRNNLWQNYNSSKTTEIDLIAQGEGFWAYGSSDNCIVETVVIESQNRTICETYLDAFDVNSDLKVSCDGATLNVYSSTGLPPLNNEIEDKQIMRGIKAWIQRVPVPSVFNWKIPTEPNWQSESIEASAKGPIAFAVDGVPIFHYERRPDVSTSLANYTSENDTVLQGELDQCGGHSGQGDDYHYHYTPVCLLDNHDLSKPIAFGLDGAPVYFGEGGTDFYGNGKYNNLNNFPEGLNANSLNDCNAYKKDDGSYAHYTTKDAPYVIGCHHSFFDKSLQIEPRPMSNRSQGLTSPFGGEFGEPIQTEILSFNVNIDGSYVMEFKAVDGSNKTSSIIYKPVENSENCWEFEFRVDKDVEGEKQTSCRN